MKKWFKLVYILYTGLVPIFGLIFLDWNALTMIIFFWFESFLFFIFNIIRIWLVSDFTKLDKSAWYIRSRKKVSKKREFLESFFFINFVSLLVYAGWILMALAPLVKNPLSGFSDMWVYGLFLVIFESINITTQITNQKGKFSKKQLFPRIERVAYFRMVTMHLSLFFGIITLYGLGGFLEIENPPVYIIGVMLSFIYLLSNIAEHAASHYESKECRRFVKIMDKGVSYIRWMIFIIAIPIFLLFGLAISLSFFIFSHIILIFTRAILVQILLRLKINKDILAPGAY